MISKTKTLLLSLLLVFFLVGSSGGKAYKGLFIMTLGTKSHTQFFSGIIDALTQNGHEMTFITPYSIKNDKVRQVNIGAEGMHSILGNAFKISMWSLSVGMMEQSHKSCVDALTNAEVEKVINEEYDYVILSMYFTECFLGHIHNKLKVPFIYASANVLMSPYSERFGSIEFPSVSPYKIFKYTYPMTFRERLVNAVASSVLTETTKFLLEQSHERLCRKLGLWPPETPAVLDLQQEVSFGLINSVRALEIPPKLAPPSVIYAGGIHIKPLKPLPKDLDDWFNGSGEAGFILFSLGTGVKPSDMKEEHLSAILKVFGSLKQRIIWKWDENHIDNLPPNVKISSWLPQQDILGHPKIRLFITHGGLFSTQEATYYGVPVIGMPVYADQHGNIAEAVDEGWGRRLNWNDLTENSFREVILDTLLNDSLRDTVSQRSKLMQDWVTTPAEEVTFWVEYAVRHKGAKHLQSPFLHMPWYQIYNADVWIFVIVCLVLILGVSFKLLKLCFTRCKKFLKIKKD